VQRYVKFLKYVHLSSEKLSFSLFSCIFSFL